MRGLSNEVRLGERKLPLSQKSKIFASSPDKGSLFAYFLDFWKTYPRRDHNDGKAICPIGG